MEIQRSKSSTVYFTLGAIISWMAVILQFYLIIVNKTVSVPETIIRFFSYFTILTNILVAICFTSAMTTRRHATPFFSKASIHSAVTVYIIVVGLVYNIILRELWAPTGLQQLVDELLHSVIPLLFGFHWLMFVSKAKLRWELLLYWLIYPLTYLAMIMTLGSFSNFYPYPFVDVGTLGYQQVLLNSFYLCMSFLALSLVLLVLGKLSIRVVKNQA